MSGATLVEIVFLVVEQQIYRDMRALPLKIEIQGLDEVNHLLLAIKGFHSQAGWIAFTTISILLVLAVEKLGSFRETAAAYLLPLLGAD